MPQTLTYTQALAMTADGMFRADRGLYVQVRDGGATRSWLFRYRHRTRTRWMGIGPVRDVKITEARRLADDARRLLRTGVDPIEHRRAETRRPSITFAEAAEQFIEARKSGWESDKHAYQWSQSLKTFAEPVLGKLPMDQISANHVVKVVEPIWTTKGETAGRVRARIESIWDWAKNVGYCHGINPAKWKGGLEYRLPALSRVQTVKHYDAVPYADAPALFGKLAGVPTTVSLALRFIALTAVRAGEGLGATWDEFDLDAEAPVWTIPARRMKMRKPHRVPLSAPAVAILATLRGSRTKPTGLVFHGGIKTKAVSDASLRKLARKHGPKMVTTHGWRSTFRDWAAEQTAYPAQVAEAALAHLLGSKVATAYLRSDLLEQRTGLMTDWAKFLAARPTVESTATGA